ncbi:hypothetical protein ACJX0J_015964 [Zea mays]
MNIGSGFVFNLRDETQLDLVACWPTQYVFTFYFIIIFFHSIILVLFVVHESIYEELLIHNTCYDAAYPPRLDLTLPISLLYIIIFSLYLIILHIFLGSCLYLLILLPPLQPQIIPYELEMIMFMQIIPYEYKKISESTTHLMDAMQDQDHMMKRNGIGLGVPHVEIQMDLISICMICHTT